MKSANYIISKTSFFCCILLLSCQSSVNQKNLLIKDNLPNIVIIYMDDLGYGDTSCYGATALETPNIDKLADGGVRFTNGYSTSATCTPSRSAIPHENN